MDSVYCAYYDYVLQTHFLVGWLPSLFLLSQKPIVLILAYKLRKNRIVKLTKITKVKPNFTFCYSILGKKSNE